jgi:hypothetical protein
MDEQLPWPPRTTMAAFAVVVLAWTLTFLLLLAGSSLGWLATFLAAWLTFGWVYTLLRS